MKGAVLYRVIPFALYMAFVGLVEGVGFLAGKGFITLSPQFMQGLYPLRAFSVAAALLLLWKNYDEIHWRDVLRPAVMISSLAAGLGVFAFWIRLDLPWATFGSPAGFDPNIFAGEGTRIFMTISRLCGAVLVVPVMEELFWRSFLIRYVISPDFARVPIGCFTWPSFLVTAVLFGFEHNLVVAGVLAGIIYNLLLYYTRSLCSCIIAHAVTNLALGIYVLNTGRWHFW